MKGAWAQHKRHLRQDLSFNNHVSDSEKVDEINKGAEALHEELMIQKSPQPVKYFNLHAKEANTK